MKRILFFCVIVLGSVIQLSAQCTPDTTITKNGIYPRSLPDAWVDSAYEQVIQLRMPKDTNSILGLVIFDSIQITSISSIPTGMNYACNTVSGYSNCTWPGGSNGCIRFYGTPPAAAYGKYFCIATVRAYVFLNNTVTYFDTQDTLLFMVNKANPAGIVKESGIKNQVEIYPNPAENNLYISAMDQGSLMNSVSIMEASGREIYTKTFPMAATYQVDISSYPKGLYFVKVRTSTGDYIRAIYH